MRIDMKPAQAQVLGQKRPGYADSSPDTTKKPRPAARPPVPTAVHQPHLQPLRNELYSTLQETNPNNLASLVSGAATNHCKKLKEDVVAKFMDASADPIFQFLSIRKDQLTMFRDRVSEQLKKDLDDFLDNTFQKELSQLLIATTHTQPRQDMHLRELLQKTIHAGDEAALQGVRDQAHRLRNPPPSTAAAPIPAQAAPYQQHIYVPPTSSTPQMETELLDAALSGDLSKVQQLVNQGVNINIAQKGGWTALMNAALQVR